MRCWQHEYLYLVLKLKNNNKQASEDITLGDRPYHDNARERQLNTNNYTETRTATSTFHLSKHRKDNKCKYCITYQGSKQSPPQTIRATISIYLTLANDVASGSEITPCIKIDSGLQVFGKRYEMTLLTSRIWQNRNVFTSNYDFRFMLMSYDLTFVLLYY